MLDCRGMWNNLDFPDRHLLLNSLHSGNTTCHPTMPNKRLLKNQAYNDENGYVFVWLITLPTDIDPMQSSDRGRRPASMLQSSTCY